MQMAALLAALSLPAIVPAAEIKAEVALRAAMEQETVKGDLKGAVEQYRKIVTVYPQDRSIAARALLHMGACYEKLGQSDAQKAYERLLRDYPEQKEAAEARARLDRDTGRKAQNGPLAQRVWAAEEAGTDYFGHVAVQIAPDGEHAAFTDWKSGNLAIRDLKTGETRFLTQDRAGDCPHDMAFSRDGKQIAFRCDGLRAPQPLKIFHADGSRPREIPLVEDGLFLSSWSPDGKQIAATKYSVGEKAQGLVLISASDGAVTRLKSTPWGGQPQAGGFSPDGRFLVYSLRKTASVSSGGVFAIAVDGSRESTLVQSGADYTDAAWTPDGKGVVFLSDRSGTRDLWFIQVADGRPQGEPVVVRPEVGKIDFKGFTRDGSLYYGTNQVDSDLYQIAFDPEKGTAAPRRISERLIGANFEPEPSPDGTLLAFFRGEPGNPGSPYTTSLVIRSVTTGKETTLLTGLFVDRQRRCIRWFPDGRSLLVHEWKSIRRVDAQTGETRTLLETPPPIWMHTEVSRDGKALFYSSLLRSSQPGAFGTLRLIRRDLETGEEKVLYQVQSGQAGLYGISLSPDGTRLAFMTSERVNNEPFRVLVTMPEKGGEVKEVCRAKAVPGNQEPLHWWGATWSRDGRYILASRSIMTEKQSDELVAFPIDGGEARVLAVMPGDIYDPTASPDGRQIFFTNARRSLELWAMRNFLPQASR
jgi:Tol biopolymer transport system component